MPLPTTTSLPDDVRADIQSATLPGKDSTDSTGRLTPMIGFWKPYRFGMSPIHLRPIVVD